MSSDHDAHGHDEAHGADDHAAHAQFDPEPATELSPGEPRTPAWAPILGGFLLLVGATYVLASPGSMFDDGAASASASAAASAAPAARPASAAAASASQKPPTINASPDQLAEAHKRLMAQAAAAAAAASASGAPVQPAPSASAGARVAPGPNGAMVPRIGGPHAAPPGGAAPAAPQPAPAPAHGADPYP